MTATMRQESLFFFSAKFKPAAKTGEGTAGKASVNADDGAAVDVGNVAVDEVDTATPLR